MWTAAHLKSSPIDKALCGQSVQAFPFFLSLALAISLEAGEVDEFVTLPGKLEMPWGHQ